MIRVLHVLPRMPIGGVGAFLINTQSTIDRNTFIFDYLVIENVPDSLFPNTVKRMGSKVFLLNDTLSLMNSFRIIKDLSSFFREYAKEYDIVHLHSANVGRPMPTWNINTTFYSYGDNCNFY